MSFSSFLFDDHKQHAHALVVSTANALAFLSGFLDFLGTTGSKILVAFIVAVFSGFGYQLGARIWRKVSGEDRRYSRYK